MKPGLSLLIFVGFMGSLSAQDPHFTQFYANPLYLNPALAGTGECSRIMVNYRNQWPSIEKGFTTYDLSVDHYARALSGGIGLMVFNDNASGIINTLHAGAIYAYHLNLSYDVQLNAGFEVSYHQQRLDWSKLVFADMIDRNTGAVIPSGTVEQEPSNSSPGVVDFAAGLVLGVREKYFVGVSAYHLTQPDLSYYSNNVEGPLYRKYTLHAGAEFVLKQGEYRSNRGEVLLQPGVLVQVQHDTQQVNAGLNLEVSPFAAGVWYRHNLGNPDGVAAFVGIMHKSIKFGYSYDFSLSKLSDGSGGAHEVSLAFMFACNKKRNRPGAIKCPEF